MASPNTDDSVLKDRGGGSHSRGRLFAMVTGVVGSDFHRRAALRQSRCNITLGLGAPRFAETKFRKESAWHS